MNMRPRQKQLTLFLVSLGVIALLVGIYLIATQKDSDWSTYRSKEHNIQFAYPSNWGNLKLISKESDDLYHLEASNTLIGEILYHVSSKQVAFIEKGTKEYALPDPDDGKTRQEILKIILPVRTIKTILAVPENPKENSLSLYQAIGGFSFSPKGDYITVDVVGYEWSASYIFEAASGVDLLIGKEDIWYDNFSESVLWSDDDKVLVIKSYLNDFGGEGSDSVFVSDYGKPSILNKIFTLTEEEHYNDSSIEDVSLDKDKVTFSASIRETLEGSIEGKKAETTVHYTNYRYDIKTKKLNKLN